MDIDGPTRIRERIRGQRYNETAKHRLSRLAKRNWAHKKWSGNAWTPLQRSRNEFSLDVAQSVLVDLRGLSDLTLISAVTTRIFTAMQTHNFRKSWNNILNASKQHRLRVTKRPSSIEMKTKTILDAASFIREFFDYSNRFFSLINERCLCNLNIQFEVYKNII